MKVYVSITNRTNKPLIEVGFPISPPRGRWSSNPPYRIEPGATGRFEMESAGFMSGTKAWVEYQLAGHPGIVCFHWNSSHSGRNSAEAPSSIPGFRTTASIPPYEDDAPASYVIQPSVPPS